MVKYHLFIETLSIIYITAAKTNLKKCKMVLMISLRKLWWIKVATSLLITKALTMMKK
jgi:hypothetical protein